jgi:hypothetical protein
MDGLKPTSEGGVELVQANTGLNFTIMDPTVYRPELQADGPRTLRDAIGPSKGRITQDDHLDRIEWVLKHIPQEIWPSTFQFANLYEGQRGIIVGGGPSLADTFSEVRYLAATRRDAIKIFAPNRSHDWMIEGERSGKKKWARMPLIPDFGVMLDPSPYVVDYQKPHPDVHYLLGVTLDPSVFIKFMRAEANASIWIPTYDGSEIAFHVKQHEIDGLDRHFVSGGSTVGLRTINLAASMGLSEIDLHGFDSCYLPHGKTLYAYDKPQTVHQLADYVVQSCFGKRDMLRVRSNNMMAKQTLEFADMIQRLPELVINGEIKPLKLRVYGDGVIPWLAWKASQEMPDFIVHGQPEKMEAKYGDCKFWDYVNDKPHEGLDNE